MPPLIVTLRLKSICAALLITPLLVLGGAGGAYAGQTRQQEHHAGLVLQFGDGSVQKYCLAFTGESISGLDLLLKTGLDVQYEVYGGMGGEVCKIGREGCDYPQQLCACQSYGPGGVYWSYHHLKNGAWQISVVGAGTYKVHDGDVEGWAWSAGKHPATTTSFEKLCAPALPSPESTAEPTLTTRPTATHQPAATPRPAGTPTAAVRATSTRAPKPPAPRTPLPAAVPTRPLEVVSTATATGAPTTAVPRTAISTGTAGLSSTLTLAVTPSLTFTSIPAQTSAPTGAPAHGPGLSPTPAAAAGPAASGDAARMIGILVGLASALGFVVWRGLVAARSRAGGGGDGDAG